MSSYILVDAMNLFHRCKHTTQGGVDIQSGLALHVIFNSIKKVWRDFKGSHVVVCLEGRSWRREIYPEYKAHRRVQAQLKSSKEKEEDAIYYEIINEFIKFLQERTNVTILQSDGVEADDWIAYWIRLHKNDNHIIVSSDTDFIQLLSSNVKIYDGIKQHLITLDGIYDDKNNLVKDKKTKEALKAPDPEWELFFKIIRGDSGDNIFSAYPKIRENKLREAFLDRSNKGFSWNNLMLQTWTDHNGIEHRVLDRYNLNKKLIDLTEQPEEILKVMDTKIFEQVSKDRKNQIGIWFLKFCETHRLVNISKSPKDYAEFLSAPYIKD